ncbi:MAG: UbiH/UbiF/VisC/COQ6 family ubiquinone biosynthesis hydroxylase [Proteobacteria bacterium]|nr:UbiH/UbiF/VisC/COQ6 family ubiquinone biosynthesis hydroxylase [Pseudomonadota bacterium]
MGTGTAQKASKGIAQDAIISGGGMVGLTLGCGLAACGLKVAVIDTAKPETQMAPAFDGRASAIAYASAKMLKAIGVWKHAEKYVQNIEEIHVSDEGSSLFVHFGESDASNKPMGYMLENRHTRIALAKRQKELANLDLYAPDRIESHTTGPDEVTVILKSGKKLAAPLLISAEGRDSPLREQAGISLNAWAYKQTGIVATIEHALPHLGIAYEKFFPEGPFAILPLTGNRSSLVWSTREEFAPVIMALTDRAFEVEAAKKVGDFLGKVRVTGPRWSFPLSFMLAERATDQRLALIGDAAHGMHPIAGQGLNMGFRDVAALVEVLVKARRAGEDLGSAVVLERYERWRRTDNVALGAITDALTRLFSTGIKPVKALRDVGLGLVQKSPPAKKFFISHARGTFGKLPSLLKGEKPL